MDARGSPGVALSVLVLGCTPDAPVRLEAVLMKEGFAPEVTHVATQQAFEQHLSNDFDVILSDHALPQRNALRALEVRNSRGLDVPFVLISNATHWETAVETMRMGAAGFVSEDRIGELGQVIRDALEQRQYHRGRARAQEHLRQRETLSHSVLSSLRAHIAVVDREGSIVLVNRAWERFAQENGGGHRTGVGSNYLQVCDEAAEMGEELASQAAEGLRALLAGSTEHFAMEYPCHAPRNWRWFEMSVLPMEGEAGERAVVAHYDISARRRAQLSKDRLAHAISHSHDAVAKMTRSGSVLSWNASAKRLYGYKASEAIGKSIYELTVPAERQEELRTAVARAYTQESPVSLETVRLDKNEQALAVSLTIIPLVDREDQVAGVYAIERDITEQKRYEQGLITARERAEEMNRVKSTILHNMSHELRTPLTGILGCAEVLAETLEGEDREFARMIQISGDRLLDSLAAILEMASLESGELPLELREVALAETVEPVLERARLRLTRKQLTAQILPPHTPITVLADRDALLRVLAHVVSNAIKFTEQGGLTISFRASGGVGCIQVADTGIGIPPEFLPHVFGEFLQAGTGLGRKHEGSGLGLAISLRLMRLMGGDIRVESTPGEGSTFTLSLPLYAASAEEGLHA